LIDFGEIDYKIGPSSSVSSLSMKHRGSIIVLAEKRGSADVSHVG
jgi:hypothetical protein